MEPKKDYETNERVRGRSRKKGSQPRSSAFMSESAETAAAKGGKTERPDRFSGGGMRIAAIVGGLAVGAAVAAAVAYTYLGQQYQNVFFPKTMINGMDASGKTVDEVKAMIASQIDGYSLTLETRQGTEETISGDVIGLHPEYDGTLEQILGEQEPLQWGIASFKEKDYTISTMMAYDQELLEQTVDQLVCMDSEQSQAPVEARISEYIAGVGYQILPEEQGTLLRREIVLDGVSEAIMNLEDRLVLEDLDAYEKPTVTAEDPELQTQLENRNRYVNVTITHRFGGSSEVLDGSTIHQWLSDDGQGGVILDESQVTQYVKDLAREYNTAYQPKTLQTSYGKEVKIAGGPYGWRINQSAEVAALLEILHSGESQTREPVYSQTAASHDGPDYGDTYVEINLTAQHLYFYKDGKLIVESDFVSGNESKGWSTPAGAYPLTYKQRDATLRGEDYETPVSYWMPFNGGIGMHDASWRNSFGGTIYKTGGSHGCINLPPAAARKIYENISAGMPVLCYHLDGTEKGASSTKPAETKAAETKAAETKAAETTAAQTQPAETTAAQPQPAETTAAQPQPAETTAAQPQPAETTAAATSQPQQTPSAQTQQTPTMQPQSTPGQQSSSAPGGTVTSPTPGSTQSSSGPSGQGSQSSSGVVSGPGQ